MPRTYIAIAPDGEAMRLAGPCSDRNYTIEARRHALEQAFPGRRIVSELAEHPRDGRTYQRVTVYLVEDRPTAVGEYSRVGGKNWFEWLVEVPGAMCKYCGASIIDRCSRPDCQDKRERELYRREVSE